MNDTVSVAGMSMGRDDFAVDCEPLPSAHNDAVS
jgi:hypothetical protein